MTALVLSAPVRVAAQAAVPRLESFPFSLGGPPVLACGAYFKNAPCLVAGGLVRFAETVGDLDRPDACLRAEAAAESLLAALDGTPAAVAHDLHPDFHSTRLARALAERLGVPTIAVQHHHAHVAAVLAEHGHSGPALGLALDGVGLGTDGTAWGGELLRVEGALFQRLGHLRHLPLAGGDRAAREPWRMAAAVLHLVGRGSEIARRFPRQPAAPMLGAVFERAHLCPPTSSLGRTFDAAAGLLGVCEVMGVEAEAAVALERLAAGHGELPDEPDAWTIDADMSLDLVPLLARLADEPQAARGAARFHGSLAAALEAWVLCAAEISGLATVALSGGCFHNRLLASELVRRLASHGLAVLQAVRLSPGDAGLALGQAWVTVHRLQEGV